MTCNIFCPQDQGWRPSDQLFCSWALPEISCASRCLVPCSLPIPIPRASPLSPILEPLSPCTQTCPVIVITSSVCLWWLSWTVQLDLADLVWSPTLLSWLREPSAAVASAGVVGLTRAWCCVCCAARYEWLQEVELLSCPPLPHLVSWPLRENNEGQKNGRCSYWLSRGRGINCFWRTVLAESCQWKHLLMAPSHCLRGSLFAHNIFLSRCLMLPLILAFKTRNLPFGINIDKRMAV